LTLSLLVIFCDGTAGRIASVSSGKPS
jgi:hypothetical protein